jgi:protein TonB
MYARYISSSSLAVLVTALLLWLMQLLIAIGPEVYKKVPRTILVDWNPDRPPEVINDDPTPVDRPPPPVAPPDNRPPMDGNEVPLAIPPFTPGLRGGRSGDSLPDLGMPDGPLVSLMYVRPVYPQEAASRGIEGHVTVQFDVDERGNVSNVLVIDSSHRLFERSAIQAAQRSRFRPRIVDGVAIATAGIRKRFRFELEK